MTTADPRARRVVFFVFLTVFLDLVGFGIVIPLLPFYVSSMHGTSETVGLILSSFSLTQLVATPFLGRLSDRLGRRPVILLSLAGNAVAMVLFALASKSSLLWLLFVSRILAGGTSGNLSACQAAIADVTRGEDRAASMGRLGAGIGLGMVLGPVIGSSVSHVGTWAPPLCAAALALLDLVGAFFLMPETRRAPDPAAGGLSAPSATPKLDGTPAVDPYRAHGVAVAAPPPRLVDVLRQPRVAMVLALYFLTFLYMTNMQVALALLTSARLAWTPKEIGYVFGLFGLIMLVVQGALIGRMTRRWGSMPLIIAGSLVSAVGLATIAFSYHPLPLVGGLALLGLGLGVANPSLATVASDAAGAGNQGTILGFAQSSGGLARTVGPVLGGLLFHRVAGGAPFIAGAVSALLALGVGVMFASDVRRASEAAPRAAA